MLNEYEMWKLRKIALKLSEERDNPQGEFTRITLVAHSGEEKRLVFPDRETNLLEGYYLPDISRDREKALAILKDTGFDLDRVELRYEARTMYKAYLVPDQAMGEVRNHPWFWMFAPKDYSIQSKCWLWDLGDFSGVDPEEILGAKEIVMEQFDHADRLLPRRVVYRTCDEDIRLEIFLCGVWRDLNMRPNGRACHSN